LLLTPLWLRTGHPLERERTPEGEEFCFLSKRPKLHRGKKGKEALFQGEGSFAEKKKRNGEGKLTPLGESLIY